MKHLLLTAALVLSGCASHWSGVTDQGVAWKAPANGCGTAPSESDCGKDLTMALWIAKTALEEHQWVQSPGWKRLRSIELIEGPLPCVHSEDTCHGLTLPDSGYYDIKLVSERCLSSTSFAHELVHYFYRAMNEEDDHTRKDLFGPGSLEAKITAELLRIGYCRKQ